MDGLFYVLKFIYAFAFLIVNKSDVACTVRGISLAVIACAQASDKSTGLSTVWLIPIVHFWSKSFFALCTSSLQEVLILLTFFCFTRHKRNNSAVYKKAFAICIFSYNAVYKINMMCLGTVFTAESFEF